MNCEYLVSNWSQKLVQFEFICPWKCFKWRTNSENFDIQIGNIAQVTNNLGFGQRVKRAFGSNVPKTFFLSFSLFFSNLFII